ncbi:hypothetical protein [Natrinema soli]|uniref:Uncharacterized protein n=1 Tax=Natrinema soli TaxID=1930624 RepID=A0ABD5SUB1_9EURY|nr:hypothetical protein [Natrinema soli]
MIAERDLARTYNGAAYEDPWTAVLDYQTVMRYANEHPNKGSGVIATALEIPRVVFEFNLEIRTAAVSDPVQSLVDVIDQSGIAQLSEPRTQIVARAKPRATNS